MISSEQGPAQRLATAVAPYIVILVIAACLCYYAFQISPGADDKLGADVWPKTILLFTVLTCAVEIFRKLFEKRADGSAAPAHPEAHVPSAQQGAAPVGRWTPRIGIALTVLYAWSFSEIGYFLATVLFVAAFVYFGNYRRPLAAALTGLVASLAFVFIFMKIVYVSLPLGRGPFGELSALIMTIMGIK
jgi:putative tricarboxylic transport membrane protein